MNTALVLTFIGEDRPGLVNLVSERIAARGGTWLESRLSRLAGKFAGIVLIGAPDDKVDSLAAALRELDAEGLGVTLERGEAFSTQADSDRILKLEVVGNERPGIVRDVTRALTELGVNIEEFSSGVEGAPFTGLEMFRATARLKAPRDLSPDALRRAVERLAGEIMVDLVVVDGDARV
jgi:glycine cleavage system regulatory protein